MYSVSPLLNSKVFSRGLPQKCLLFGTEETEYDSWVCSATAGRGAWEFQQAASLGWNYSTPWEVRRHSLKQRHVPAWTIDQLADLRICGVNVWKLDKERQGPLSCGHLCSEGSQGFEAGVPEWAMGHKPSCQPTNPGKALELSWSLVLPPFCAFYEEIELASQPGDEWYLWKQAKCACLVKRLRSCIWRFSVTSVDERGNRI